MVTRLGPSSTWNTRSKSSGHFRLKSSLPDYTDSTGESLDISDALADSTGDSLDISDALAASAGESLEITDVETLDRLGSLDDEEFDPDFADDFGTDWMDKDFDMNSLMSGGNPNAMTAMKESGSTEKYSWTQTDSHMYLKVPLPVDTLTKSIEFDLSRTHISIGVKDATPIVSGDLGGACRSSSSFWIIEENEDGRKVMAVDIEKASEMDNWELFLKTEGDPSFAEVTNSIFLDISVDGANSDRVVIGLFGKAAPRTVENFRCLCTGEKGTGEKGEPLHYKGSNFHRIIPGFMLQGGDFTAGDGTGGESIYGAKFDDESFVYKHLSEGLLSMANSGEDSNGSQFFITVASTPWLDEKHVVFGRVLEGMETIKALELKGNPDGSVESIVTISDCGEL
eukprot:CAMPEP_0185773742 /NCGR_PEP_ID=MMETSP1174-20130828/74916_1 /TAXON_ID=35687 /ORGANISM="Dictyocha speculum, Strain CCMP1381" /LENGTH=396 /DNA_ID=CAMNT_0028460557 /DNA_START=93 /DNA_END=1283 /DNA_ORIENTATION=-